MATAAVLVLLAQLAALITYTIARDLVRGYRALRQSRDTDRNRRRD